MGERERKEQLRRKARMRYAEIVKEQGVKQREGRERLKEKASMTYVRIRKDARKKQRLIDTRRDYTVKTGLETYTHTRR